MVMIWISIEFENDWYEGKIVQTLKVSNFGVVD